MTVFGQPRAHRNMRGRNLSERARRIWLAGYVAFNDGIVICLHGTGICQYIPRVHADRRAGRVRDHNADTPDTHDVRDAAPYPQEGTRMIALNQ